MTSLSKTSVSLILNSNQKQRSIILLDGNSENLMAQVKQAAKNKLKLKNPDRFFVVMGKNLAYELPVSEDSFKELLLSAQNVEIVVSKGEDYVGTLTPAHPAKSDARKPSLSVKIIAKDSLIDEKAVKQIEETGKKCPCIFQASGMPDLHPGGTFPIGISFLSENNVIYPALVGNDIGCGMSLYQTEISAKSIRPESVKKQLTKMEGPWSEWQNFCIDEFLIPESEEAMANILKDWSDVFSNGSDDLKLVHEQIGTIGGGNHFAELLAIDQVLNENFLPPHFDATKAFLLIHSGSRSLGQKILQAQNNQQNGNDNNQDDHYSGECVVIGSESGDRYLSRHNFACDWARKNRKLIAMRFHYCLNIPFESSKEILDVWHNTVTPVTATVPGHTGVWVHRKGAAPTDQGHIVIPGSRGAHSYLVLPNKSDDETLHLENGFSLAHGAGRKIPRGKTHQKIRQKLRNVNGSDFNNKSASNMNLLLSETPFQSAVICEDSELLAEEHQDAYKDIENIIHDLEHFGLITVVARLKPLVTYKMRTS